MWGYTSYISNCSILIFIPSITDFNWDASLVVMEHAMTGRDTPQARPRAILLHSVYVYIFPTMMKNRSDKGSRETGNDEYKSFEIENATAKRMSVTLPWYKNVRYVLIFAQQW